MAPSIFLWVRNCKVIEDSTLRHHHWEVGDQFNLGELSWWQRQYHHFPNGASCHSCFHYLILLANSIAIVVDVLNIMPSIFVHKL
jgi:hypothetical protein